MKIAQYDVLYKLEMLPPFKFSGDDAHRSRNASHKCHPGGFNMLLGLIKCRICDEDIGVYDAEKVIIHYSTCTKCKTKSDYSTDKGLDLGFRPDWKQT